MEIFELSIYFSELTWWKSTGKNRSKKSSTKENKNTIEESKKNSIEENNNIGNNHTIIIPLGVEISFPPTYGGENALPKQKEKGQ